MSQKVFSLTAGVIFSLIALLHILRIVYRWQAMLEGRTMAMWASWVAVLIAGYLAYQGFRLASKT